MKDPNASLAWYVRAFGGDRATVRGREGIRYRDLGLFYVFASKAGALDNRYTLGEEDAPSVEHLGAMGFEYPGGRPRGVLSKDVRRIGAGMMKEMADALMAGNGLKAEDIAHFVLHSAGRRVIEQVGKLMALDETRLAHSRNVLQQYGNMSSATVVFVLDDLLRSREPVPGDWGLMIALGPGFAAEGALLRW